MQEKTSIKRERLTREQMSDEKILILINAINNQYKRDLKYSRSKEEYQRVLHSFDIKRFKLFKALEENIKR